MTQGGRILVVDDETLVRETVGTLLADEGYVVEQAANGTDAIAKVAEIRPDAIVLDLMMPGMNGKQFLDALRALGHGDVPVIVMTAVQGLAQGVFPPATDVIEKPFELDDLLNKVALAVYRGSTRVAGGARAVRKTKPPPTAAPRKAPDRGVVLLVDRDRTALQRLDALLSQRGYTVVSMTRVTAQLPRLARALEPRAIILDTDSGLDVATGVDDTVRALREIPDLAEVPILVFARKEHPTAMVQPVDEDLIQFVEGAARS